MKNRYLCFSIDAILVGAARQAPCRAARQIARSGERWLPRLREIIEDLTDCRLRLVQIGAGLLYASFQCQMAKHALCHTHAVLESGLSRVRVFPRAKRQAFSHGGRSLRGFVIPITARPIPISILCDPEGAIISRIWERRGTSLRQG